MSKFFPVEYQDWVLVAFTGLFLFSLIFPIYLSGFPHQKARSLAAFLNRYYLLYLFSVFFVSLFLFLFLVALLPDWTISDYFSYLFIVFKEIARHLSVLAQSSLILLSFFLLFVLRDRIKILLGIEHVYLFKCTLKELLSCFLLSPQTRALEVYVYKVEELTSVSSLSANDVFVELSCGRFNELVRTRVRKGAGASAVLKETVQLNFDEEEEEDLLKISVRHMDSFGSKEIGVVEFSARDVGMIVGVGEMGETQQFRLQPQGKIWLGLSWVNDDEEGLVDGQQTGFHMGGLMTGVM